MAPNRDLLRDIGIFAAGIIIFALSGGIDVIRLVAFLGMAYAVAHVMFSMDLHNMSKITEKKR